MTSCDTLLFDLGNVLIDIDIPGAIARIEALCAPALDAETVRSAIFSVTAAYERGQLTTEQFLAEMRIHMRSDVTSQEIIQAWNSMLIGFPPHRLTLLDRLCKHYHVYILSNTNPLHLHWVHDHLLNDLGITDFEARCTHGCFYSHLIGARKPDAQAFSYVSHATGLTPARTLFMDDLPENIHAARTLGFQTHWSPPDEDIATYLELFDHSTG